MAREMDRRDLLKLMAAGAAATAIPPGVFGEEATLARPNVLFIAVDDLNDWTGCLGGHPDVKTPNIDRLAQRGVLFTNAFCSAPACNPSRTSLLTGFHPSTSGVYRNSQPWRPMLPDAVTLPQHFMAHGYQVIGGGKIFHSRFEDPASWHEHVPFPGNPNPPARPLNGIPNTAHFDWGPLDVSDEQMGDWQLADWAEKELAKERDKPLFLAVGFIRPHLPWYVPRKYFDLYPPDAVTLPDVNEDDLEDVPVVGRNFAKPDGDHKKVIETHNWRKAVSAYLASISFLDGCVGKVLDGLDRGPCAKTTIVVLWGDHGWHLGEKLHWRKFALWEEATHCPLMIAGPDGVEVGGRCARTVSLLDIYPTLNELCGLKPNPALEGKSLAGLLRTPGAAWDRPALTTHERNNHSVRSERWRYIRYHDGTEELYDRDHDPLEWTNLAGKGEYGDVKQALAAWLPKMNAPEAPEISKKKKAARNQVKQEKEETS